MRRNYIFSKLTATLLSVIVTVSAVPSYSFADTINVSDTFTDVQKGNWEENGIMSLVHKGVISGYPDGTFKPNQITKRGEFVSLLNKIFGLKNSSEIKFTDVPKELWCYDAICVAVGEGYIAGYPDGTFKPNAPITREESAVLLAKILEKRGEKIEGGVVLPKDEISPWAKEAVAFVMSKKLMSGYPDGTFKPTRQITRAESAVLINQSDEYIKGNFSGKNDTTNQKEEPKKENYSNQKDKGDSSGGGSGSIQPKETLSMYHLENNYYVFNVKPEMTKAEIHSLLKKQYPTLKQYYIGKIFKDNTKVFLYLEDGVLNCPSLAEVPEGISGIYVGKDGEFIGYEEGKEKGRVSLFVGEVKLDTPFETTETVLGLKGNEISGGLDLQANTRKIDGLNFHLEKTEKKSMVYQSAIAQSSSVKSEISNLEITNNTFDFGNSTVSAKNAIIITSKVGSGYLKINHNTVKGWGAENNSTFYSNYAIAIKTQTEDGTLTEIKNNEISDYGYNGISVSVGNRASVSIENNILNNLGQNGIGAALFGKGEEVSIKNNTISHYGSKKIMVKKSFLSSETVESDAHEEGLTIGYIGVVRGVKFNGKYYSNQQKFLQDLSRLNNIEEKEINDKNEGVLNCTPIKLSHDYNFRNPIEEINKPYSRLQDAELIIVKDDDEDLLLPNEQIKEKTVKSLKIVGEGSGKVILNQTLSITDDLTIDLPNCNLQNNAKVDKEKVHIIRIRDNDYSNFVIKPEMTTIPLKTVSSLAIQILDIQDKEGKKVAKEQSNLTNNIKVFVNDETSPDFTVNDEQDTVILNKTLLDQILRFATVKIEYQDNKNNVSGVKKSFDVKVENSSTLKAEFEKGAEPSIIESFAPEEGLRIKITEVKNASGESVQPSELNLKDGVSLKISYREAKPEDFEIDGDTITIKKEFLDTVSVPLFALTQDVIISVTDLQQKVLDAKATLKIKVLNHSGGEVTPISTLTFTQGKAPESGMTFKITSLRNAKGEELSKNEIDLENCVDIEPFPVDWKDDSLEKLEDGRIRFNRKYLSIDKEQNTITIKKEYLNKLVVNDKDTEFGTKQIIVKYRDKRVGIDFRSDKFLIHIKKALKPLSNDTSIVSSEYTIQGDKITSGNSSITKNTTVSELMKHIHKGNERQVLRVYDKKYILNGKLDKNHIYNYRKSYENMVSGDYLAVTAEDGIAVKVYEILFEGSANQSLISVKDSSVILNLGATFIEVTEKVTTSEQLKAALEVVQGASLQVLDKQGNSVSEIKDGYQLVAQKENQREERIIKLNYSKKTYRALIIANSDYGNEKLNLVGPKNDKVLMKKVFENQEISSNPFEKITVEENVDKAQFLAKIKEAFEGANSNDVSYLYYSGHGNNIDGVSYICTTDLKENKEEQKQAWISVNELREALDDVPGMKVLIFDSCNAGGFIGKKVDAITTPTPNSSKNAKEFNENIEKVFVKQEEKSIHYLTSNDYKVLTASSEDEYSFEDKKEKVGKFTKVLSQVAGIYGNVVGDTDNDGKVSLEEAYRYLEDNVVYTSHIQAFPRNDSYTLFEVGANAKPISSDTSVQSTKQAGEDELLIIIRGTQRLIKSKKFLITEKVTVDEFLSKIVKGHPNQQLRVVKRQLQGMIEKKGTDLLEKLDFLEVTAEDGTKANYIITVQKVTGSDVLTISSKKDEKEIAYYTIIHNAKLIRSSLKKLTEETTVEEFLSNIVKGDAKQTLSVIDKNKQSKIDSDKLASGDKLLVRAESGKTAEYTIILDKKPLELVFKDNAFKVVQESGSFGTKIVSDKKELDTNVTVEEFLNLIVNKDKFKSIKLNSGNADEPKKKDEKLEQGDYLLVATGGYPKRYTLMVKKAGTPTLPEEPKPPQEEKNEPDFGEDFAISKNQYGLGRIVSKDTKIVDTMTVQEFLSKMKNKDKFQKVVVKSGGYEKSSDEPLKAGDRLFVELKSSNSGGLSVTPPPQIYTIVVEKASVEPPQEEIKEPDFGGVYKIGVVNKSEIISGTKELTTDTTVEEFIASIKNSSDYDSIVIKEAYEEHVKENNKKIESDDKLVLKKGTQEKLYYLRNVTSSGGGIVIPGIPTPNPPIITPPIVTPPENSKLDDIG